jgi:predicted acyltransferase (DUF342 family)
MQRNIAGMRMPRLLAVFCWAVLLLAGPAGAASYDFPAAMPAGCSGSNGSYTCSITSLSWGDTVSISGTKPASITFSGNLDLNSARINPSGSASDLTLVVRGRLRPGYQAVVNAAVQANEIDDADGAVSFGGSLRTTAGRVRLGYQSSVAGNVTVSAGNAELADQAVVRGHISASAQVTTAYRSQVGGGITAGSTITIGQETTVAGAIVAGGSANISIGYGATVVGDIRAHAGTVTLAQAAVAKACVQTLTSSRAVTLGLQATVAGVCCGNQGSCSNSCVRNNTTAAMPALCTVPNGSGLTGVYFNNMTLTDPASLKRVDGTVGFDWVNAAPATGVPADRFSIRWTGFVRVPVTGSYRFQTRSDDGVRLWVNSVQLVNNWTNHGATLDNSSAITLNAGVDYPITMEFYENGGQAVAALHWLRPGDAVYTIIPPGTADGGGLFTEEQAPLIASYDFNEASYNGTAGELIDGAGYGGGPFHGKAQGAARPTTASSTPAIPGTPGTCSYASLAGPVNNGPGFIVTGLPVSTAAGAKTTVAFWMYWSGSGNGMPIGWHLHDLWFSGANFGFNTAQGDVHGVPSASLAKTWRHVVAVFTNGSVIDNKLYIDGVAQSLTRLAGTPSTANAVVSSSLQIGGWGANTNYRFIGLIDQVRVFNGELTAGQVAALHAETAPCPPPAGPHHLEIQHASGTGLTCTPSTVTVRACADAACSSDYTGGVTGTLGATGGSVAWPAGTAFSIPSGSGSTTVSLQVTTTTPAVLGVASSTPAASNAASCNFGSPACTFTAADAGLLFDLPHHRSDTSQAFTVQAVRKSDNGLACTPAFANVTRSVTFRCSYDNPTTGSLPARVGGSALNASGDAAAACDSGGRAVSLAFNASGVASTSLQYADAGQLTLSATYTGGAATSDTGLVMSGSDSFIAAPERFTLGSVTAGPIRAGSSFSATVTARNANGAATPNFGRETGAETLYVGWARLQPTGGGAADGSFSGSFGSFANGSASATNLAWTEVGRGDLVVRSTNAGGYLGSGLLAYGTSAGNAITCANENSTCALPAGTTATVYYGERGTWVAKAGQTGNVACSNAEFRRPAGGRAQEVPVRGHQRHQRLRRRRDPAPLQRGRQPCLRRLQLRRPAHPHHGDGAQRGRRHHRQLQWHGHHHPRLRPGRDAGRRQRPGPGHAVGRQHRRQRLQRRRGQRVAELRLQHQGHRPAEPGAARQQWRQRRRPGQLGRRHRAHAAAAQRPAAVEQRLRQGHGRAAAAGGGRVLGRQCLAAQQRRQLHRAGRRQRGPGQPARRHGRGQRRHHQRRCAGHRQRQRQHHPGRTHPGRQHPQPGHRPQPGQHHCRPVLQHRPPRHHRRRPALVACPERQLRRVGRPRPRRTRQLRHLCPGNPQDRPCTRPVLTRSAHGRHAASPWWS